MKVNLRQLSDLTGMGHRRIRKLLKNVPRVESKDRRSVYYESSDALPAIYLNKNGDDDLDLSHEKALLARAQREKYDLQNLITKKELVPMARVLEIYGRTITSAKIQFLALGDRLGRLLETAQTFEDRKALIDSEVRGILTALSEDRAYHPDGPPAA